MTLTEVCIRIGLRDDGLDYAAGSLGINRTQDVSRSNIERIYNFLKLHSPYAAGIMTSLQALAEDRDIFWILVKNAQQTDQGSIKFIYVSTANFEYKVAGIKYFKATMISEGRYQLEAREAWTSEFCEAVYWLPYVPNAVTSVNRAVYEANGAVDFFLTIELSGCRFTVTDQSVYHVAFDAGATKDAKGRDAAEVRAMTINHDDGRNPRRLSISGDDFSSYGYGFFESEKCRATVIGVRQPSNSNQAWVYKAIIYHSLAYVPDSNYKSMVQILDNTKFVNDSLWAEKYQ
jgi:hypothetical protein